MSASVFQTVRFIVWLKLNFRNVFSVSIEKFKTWLMRFIGRIQLSQVCRATTRIVCFLPRLPRNMNPTFCCFFGGWGGEGWVGRSSYTSSKRGGGRVNRISVFREGLLGKKIDFFQGSCNFYIKNKLKSEIINDKKKVYKQYFSVVIKNVNWEF